MYKDHFPGWKNYWGRTTKTIVFFYDFARRHSFLLWCSATKREPLGVPYLLSLDDSVTLSGALPVDRDSVPMQRGRFVCLWVTLGKVIGKGITLKGKGFPVKVTGESRKGGKHTAASCFHFLVPLSDSANDVEREIKPGQNDH